MFDFLLALSPARAFLLTGGLYLLGRVSIGLYAVLTVMSWPGRGPFLWAGLVGVLLGGSCTLAWFGAVIKRCGGEAARGSLGQRINLIIAIVALATWLVLPYGYYVGVTLGPLADGFGLRTVVGSPAISLFAFASYVLVTYRAVTALERREGIHRSGAKSRWTGWLLFALQPLGVWTLQRRIQRALSGTSQVELTDHLIAGDDERTG